MYVGSSATVYRMQMALCTTHRAKSTHICCLFGFIKINKRTLQQRVYTPIVSNSSSHTYSKKCACICKRRNGYFAYMCERRFNLVCLRAWIIEWLVYRGMKCLRSRRWPVRARDGRLLFALSFKSRPAINWKPFAWGTINVNQSLGQAIIERFCDSYKQLHRSLPFLQLQEEFWKLLKALEL